MATGPSRLDDAMTRLENGDVSGIITGLFVGTLMTMAYQFWSLIENLGSTIAYPFRKFGEALGTLIWGSVGGPTVLLEASIQTGVQSLTSGIWAELGIFAYPVTMLSVMAGIYIFARAWERIDLSPWNFLRSLRR